MATHLVETIQKNLSLPPLQKIDPNIQETKESVPRQSQEKLAQAAIPAVLTAFYKFSKNLNLKAGINNLLDERYFTRRAGGYPGPGALPADGRTFFMSFGVKL